MTAKIEKSRAKSGGAKVFSTQNSSSLSSWRLNVGLESQLFFFRQLPGEKDWKFLVAQSELNPDTVGILENRKRKGFTLVSDPQVTHNETRHKFPFRSRLMVEKRTITREGKVKTTRQFVRAT